MHMFGYILTSKKQLNQLHETIEEYKSLCSNQSSQIETLKAQLKKYMPLKGKDGKYIKKN